MTTPRQRKLYFWATSAFIALFIALQIAFAAILLAEPRPCVDTLAAAKFGEELKHIPNHVGVTGFANTFGDFFPVAKKELARGREFIRIQGVWKDNHSFGNSDLKLALKEARRYEDLCVQYPGKVEFSPFTEHTISKPDSWLDQIAAAAPHCRVVNNPWVGKGGFSKKYKSEVHNLRSNPPGRPYNFSYDGESSVDDNVSATLQRYSDADVLCVWHPRLNLRWRMKDGTPRSQRIKEAKKRKPDKRLLESLVFLFSPPGRIDVPAHWLVKSHADNHGPNVIGQMDAKGDKLLIISPVKQTDKKGRVKPIQLKRAGVKKPVGKLGYYGTFNDEKTGRILGYRYYASKFGYEYGANLQPWIGKKQFGWMNGGFRAGKL